MLSGKKTYLVAAATIAYALGGLYLGNVSFAEAVALITPMLGLSALRAAVK